MRRWLLVAPHRGVLAAPAARRRAHMAWRGNPSASRTPKRTPEAESLDKVRNIGIMAHIDAGKTTTTERMLYYCGAIRSMGEVHDGDTTMDYLDQERARGITITSAAISFLWRQHRINLIDTPGHVDFTVEVERALRVLDGAVAVFDASAGVEAQTLTVWRQSSRYNVPVIAYLNKMDKYNADFQMATKSIEEKLHVPSLVLQLPVGAGKDFCGVVDLLTMSQLTWPPRGDGSTYEARLLDESTDGALWESASAARTRLVEQTADLDDRLATQYLEADSVTSLTEQDVRAALRRVTLARAGLPTLCGSSYRNVGVQPLLDAIIQYLPSPSARDHPGVDLYENTTCALAFKTVHDRQRGPLTYVRVYSGALEPGQKVYNANREKTERLTKVMTPHADQLVEETRVGAGSISVVTGLKETITGDTLVESQTSLKRARKIAADGTSGEVSPVLLGVQLPEPVFFCSVEPPSLAKSKDLDYALECLQREDPSLRVEVNTETGQTVLSGMGELHLSVIKQRILKEYKVDADMGEPQVSYREMPLSGGDHREQFVRRIADTNHSAIIHLHLSLVEDTVNPPGLELLRTGENADHLRNVRRNHFAAAERGVRAALSHGPILGYPVVNVRPRLSWLEVAPRTAEHVISAAASRCVATILKCAGCRLLEPIMSLHVTTDPDHMSAVLADLSHRRSQILDVLDRHGTKVVVCETPLAELKDYSTVLRTVSSGTATFSMELSAYKPMSAQEEAKAIESVTGISPF